MIIDIKAPTPGESITEVQIADWLVKTGDYVAKDAEIAEIDSDKATLTINAETAGSITILIETGETVSIGTVIAQIYSDAKAPEGSVISTKVDKAEVISPATASTKPVPAPITPNDKVKITPLARKIMEEKQLSGRDVLEQLGHTRITRQDVLDANSGKVSIQQGFQAAVPENSREVERKKMTTLRLKLAERLVGVKNETAMLTTFNEVNMSQIMNLKKLYKDKFQELYGIGIGFMSFFTKAVTIALGKFPQVNSMIDGDELVFHKYADIGIAVSAPKGLVVPVIRNAESLSLAEIELKIKLLAGKARENKITLEEMTGGTFTITNGGVFGSMM